MTTQVEELPPVPSPLTKPVPGAWMQPIDRSLGPVYVPYEPYTRKDERTGKDVVDGYAPGAHIQRLLNERWMYTSGPEAIIPEQNVELAAAENALRSELDQKNAQIEAMMAELKSIREKLANDTVMPNAAKRK